MAAKFASLYSLVLLSVQVFAQAPADSTPLDPGFVSRVISYEAQVTRDPKYPSIASVAQTALPRTLDMNDLLKPGKTVSTESWFGALPTDVKTWLASVASEEKKLMSSTDGPLPPAPSTGKASGTAQASAVPTGVASGFQTGNKAATSAASATGASAASTTAAKKNGAGVDQSGLVRFATSSALFVAAAISGFVLL
jgi:hypothetical protein